MPRSLCPSWRTPRGAEYAGGHARQPKGENSDRTRPTDAHAGADAAAGPGPDTSADTARPGTAEPSPSTPGLTAPRRLEPSPMSERFAVVAKLRPGSRARAEEIIAEGPPFALRLAGLRRHGVFLSDDAVIFVFEGPGVERRLRSLVNDPTSSGAFSKWAPILDGTPTLAHEKFFWEK